MMMFAGYMLACIAASLVLALGTLGPDWNELFAAFGVNSATRAIDRDVDPGRIWARSSFLSSAFCRPLSSLR